MAINSNLAQDSFLTPVYGFLIRHNELTIIINLKLAIDFAVIVDFEHDTKVSFSRACCPNILSKMYLIVQLFALGDAILIWTSLPTQVRNVVTCRYQKVERYSLAENIQIFNANDKDKI